MTYSPHDLLPAPLPSNTKYPKNYFYEKVAKHLIKDTVRIMNNGLGIDLAKVVKLEETIQESIDNVYANLHSNPHIKAFLDEKYQSILAKELAKRNSSRLAAQKSPADFIKPFKPGDMTHRSYFMYIYATERSIALPTELLPTGIPKWSAKLLRKFATNSPILTKLLNKSIPATNPTAIKAMELLAQHKADLYNSKRQPLSTIDLPEQVFNPRSSDDKHLLLTGMLGYESGKLTDSYNKYERLLANSARYGDPPPPLPKNKWSWGRKEMEALSKTVTDPDHLALLNNLVEFSFGDKIKTSFIPAFYKYTVDSRLYANLKLLGAKSGRFTSNNPNMLQLPSTGSIYAKPVKKCFVAPPGKVILTADFNALEDRVLASITLDEGKCTLLEDSSLDGHCYNALGYYPNDCAPYLDSTLSHLDQVRKFKQLVEEGHPELTSIRQRSKAVTFKLAYLGMADADRGGVITQEVYDNYHTKLYPGVRSYIDNYVMPTSNQNGSIHLGLGFSIDTDNADKDQRTLHNATIQFWSILSILTINKLHSLIDEANLQDDVKIISSIYDSVYIETTADADIIKWTNDNLIRLMVQDFIPNQRIPNTAESEIGLNWSDLHPVPNNADTDTIQTILDSL